MRLKPRVAAHSVVVRCEPRGADYRRFESSVTTTRTINVPCDAGKKKEEISWRDSAMDQPVSPRGDAAMDQAVHPLGSSSGSTRSPTEVFAYGSSRSPLGSSSVTLLRTQWEHHDICLYTRDGPGNDDVYIECSL